MKIGEDWEFHRGVSSETCNIGFIKCYQAVGREVNQLSSFMKTKLLHRAFFLIEHSYHFIIQLNGFDLIALDQI